MPAAARPRLGAKSVTWAEGFFPADGGSGSSWPSAAGRSAFGAWRRSRSSPLGASPQGASPLATQWEPPAEPPPPNDFTPASPSWSWREDLQEVREAEAARPSTPWRKGQLQGLPWEHGVKWELGILNATESPIYLRARSKVAKGGMVRARSTGRLGDLRAAVREGNSLLGTEDLEVKRVKRLLREAETCARTCRELGRAADCDLAALTRTMEQLALVIPRAKYLATTIGPGIWEDPALAWGLETMEAWEVHRPVLQDLMEKGREGVQAFCDGWLDLALGPPVVVEAGFGAVPTRELLRLPGAGPALAEALGRRWAAGAGLWSGDLPPPVAPRDDHGLCVLEAARVRNLLSELEPPQIDSLVLAPCTDGRHAVAAAAAHSAAGAAVLCPLHQAVLGEDLRISEELRAQLERPRAASREAGQGSLVARLETARARLGERLGVDARHLCLRRLPPNGLALRLFPVAGQPSAAEAARLLGPGAVAEAPPGHGDLARRELRRWRAAGSLATDYFGLLVSTSAALAAARASAGLEPGVEAHFQEAQEAFEAADAEAKQVTKAWKEAQKSFAELKKLVRQLEKEVEHWLYSGAEDADVKVEETEEKQAEAVAQRDEMKKREAELAVKSEEVSGRRDAAKAVADGRRRALEAARQATSEAERKAADLAAKCEALLRMPLLPRD